MRKQFKYLGFYDMGKTTQTSKGNGVNTLLAPVHGSKIEKGGYEYIVEEINGELTVMTVHYGRKKLSEFKHYKLVSV